MTQTILEHYNKIFDNIYNKLYEAYDLLDDIIYDIQDEQLQLEYLNKEQTQVKNKIKLPAKKASEAKKMAKSCDKSMPMSKKKK